MTQEGRVEDFWTSKRRNRPDEDNVRPLLKALAAARRSLDEDHLTGEPDRDIEDAIVVDIRPAARSIPWSDTAIEFIPDQPNDPEAATVHQHRQLDHG